MFASRIAANIETPSVGFSTRSPASAISSCRHAAAPSARMPGDERAAPDNVVTARRTKIDSKK
ncbi:hypothetical protein [Burkholderia oklahomensis]|uniref:hypothetical protein n=1 Tax=Burkholderia oklahomensis TaxID=342113 RepID=UPI0002D82482|nr:hypothetical protein [Burkholderia oklahomensis]QPS36207.1 hypothetical protein I6G57_12700 [Burkholderia oklahomensis]